MKSTGSWYAVLAGDKIFDCRIRGKLRLEGIKETNPVAVGDHVTFEMDGSEGVISQILPRTNHVLRQSVKKTGHSNVLAANVDQVLLLATVKQPRTSLGFLDRVFVSAESFRIPQVLFFNKTDLLSPAEVSEVESLSKLYSNVGVTVLNGSASNDANVDGVQALLQGKVTLVAGHSGVGKSTLLNRLSPEILQSVNSISDFSEKGMHTTTFAQMFQLNQNTFVIDTPGIKEWGLVDMEQQEISDYFPEMREIRTECKFGARCLHLAEPHCAVKDAVSKGAIAESRYASYVSMATGNDNRK